VKVEGEEIKPCLGIESIGRLGEEKEVLMERFKQKIEQVKLERGCGQCPAQDNCSFCPFPFPFTPEEFCQAKKRLHGLSAFFDEMEKALLKKNEVHFRPPD
jgi:hypothetical protein